MYMNENEISKTKWLDTLLKCDITLMKTNGKVQMQCYIVVIVSDLAKTVGNNSSECDADNSPIYTMTYPNHNERLRHKQSTLLLTRYREQGIPGSQAFPMTAAGIILITGRNMQRPILALTRPGVIISW